MKAESRQSFRLTEFPPLSPQHAPRFHPHFGPHALPPPLGHGHSDSQRGGAKFGGFLRRLDHLCLHLLFHGPAHLRNDGPRAVYLQPGAQPVHRHVAWRHFGEGLAFVHLFWIKSSLRGYRLHGLREHGLQHREVLLCGSD